MGAGQTIEQMAVLKFLIFFISSSRSQGSGNNPAENESFRETLVAEAEALGDLLVTLDYHGFFPDDADVTAENLGTWIADELENGDFSYLTDLNGAPELPENFGANLAQTVRSFDEMTTLLGIGDEVIEEFIVGLYTSNEEIPDLGALIDTELDQDPTLSALVSNPPAIASNLLSSISVRDQAGATELKTFLVDEIGDRPIQRPSTTRTTTTTTTTTSTESDGTSIHIFNICSILTIIFVIFL